MINRCLSLWPQASPQTLSIRGCPSVKCAALIFTGQVVTFWYCLPKSALAPSTKHSRYAQIALVTKPGSMGTCSSAGKPCSSLALWGFDVLAATLSKWISASLFQPDLSSFPFFISSIDFPANPLREQNPGEYPQAILSFPLTSCSFCLVHPFFWAGKCPHPSLDTPVILMAPH